MSSLTLLLKNGDNVKGNTFTDNCTLKVFRLENVRVVLEICSILL